MFLQILIRALSHLFRCAVKQPLQLVFPASLMSRVEDVDFRLGASRSTDLRQFPANVVITFFQILHRTFLGKEWICYPNRNNSILQ